MIRPASMWGIVVLVLAAASSADAQQAIVMPPASAPPALAMARRLELYNRALAVVGERPISTTAPPPASLYHLTPFAPAQGDARIAYLGPGTIQTSAGGYPPAFTFAPVGSGQQHMTLLFPATVGKLYAVECGVTYDGAGVYTTATVSIGGNGAGTVTMMDNRMVFAMRMPTTAVSMDFAFNARGSFGVTACDVTKLG